MKAFKPLPRATTSGLKKLLLFFKFLKLTEKNISRAVLWTTLFYYILIIVCIMYI